MARTATAKKKSVKKKTTRKTGPKLNKAACLDYLRQMMEIRFFEEKVFELLGKDIIKGASHLYAGQEATAVGAIAAITDDDLITSTHRGHGHCLAMGDKHARSSKAKQEHLDKMMAELCGKSTGYCRGRGGSMHIADVETGNLGATGIVGGNIPVAVGAALAVSMRETGQVVLCFFGDGASNTGTFHEALNMAGNWSLPVVFICENNMYGMSVPFEKATKIKDVANRACAYGFCGEVVDGMNVLEVKDAVEKAVAKARQGKGPVLLECKTYRWYGHSRSDPRAYRTKKEEADWRARCPIETFKKKLIAAKTTTKKEIDAIEKKAMNAIELATEFALNSANPDPSELYEDVYVPYSPSRSEIEAECDLRAKVCGDSSMRELTMWQALVEAMDEEMQRDDRIFVMGEDVGLYGGAYGATRGLFKKYGPERVRDTAISEAAIAGGAVGAAMAGMRPVAEIMYVDFTPIAMDQLANQGAKNRYMFGGKTTVPIVMRTEGGAGRSIAAHHSQSLEALWVHFPGIYVVMPATPYDAKGLLKSAIRNDNPVLFIEHKMLYGTKGRVPEHEYTIPLGVADIKREGTDVTVLAYSRMLHVALQAAETVAQEGIEIEVIDPRSLKPLDTDAIVESVKKTGRFIVVSEGYRMNGFACEAMAVVNELAFDYLDAPMVRVASADVPVPMSETLEDAAIPNATDVVEAIRGIL